MNKSKYESTKHPGTRKIPCIDSWWDSDCDSCRESLDSDDESLKIDYASEAIYNAKVKIVNQLVPTKDFKCNNNLQK
jgi:hypothetical protein